MLLVEGGAAMIDVRDWHIGERVAYRPVNQPDAVEVGIITAFNRAYVFVRYGDDPYSKATLRENLEWCGDVAS